MKTMYLCGPITGLSTTEARHGWREQIINELQGIVECISPLRHYNHLKHVTELSALGNPQHVLTSPRGLTTRDRFDTNRSDLLFCNLLNTTRVSIGSVGELFWADAYRIPTIVCMEEEGNLHDHAMINEITGFRCTSLDEGIETARAILTPGV